MISFAMGEFLRFFSSLLFFVLFLSFCLFVFILLV